VSVLPVRMILIRVDFRVIWMLRPLWFPWKELVIVQYVSVLNSVLAKKRFKAVLDGRLSIRADFCRVTMASLGQVFISFSST